MYNGMVVNLLEEAKSVYDIKNSPCYCTNVMYCLKLSQGHTSEHVVHDYESYIHHFAATSIR